MKEYNYVIGLQLSGYTSFYQAYKKNNDIIVYYNSQTLCDDEISINDDKIIYFKKIGENSAYTPQPKNIKVTGCSNCPFMVSDYDDYAVGYDTIDKCSLAVFLNLKNTVIEVYNMFEENGERNTPDWCPLKANQKYIISWEKK